MKSLRELLVPQPRINTMPQDCIENEYFRKGWNMCVAEVIEQITKLEQSAVKVYGRNNGHWSPSDDWVNTKNEPCTHVATILCIEPIAKPVSKDEILSVLKRIKSYNDEMNHFGGSGTLPIEDAVKLADRISLHGIAQSSGEG